MGLIGKIALIGIVSVAVLIAVIWDVQNQNRSKNSSATTGEEIEKDLPGILDPQETPSPAMPQDENQPEAREPEGQKPEETPGENPEIPQLPESPPEPAAAEPAELPSEQPQTLTKYVIQRNDTLSGIAEKFYGDKNLWRAVYEANRDEIKNPEVLVVGKEIVIPSVKKSKIEKPATRNPLRL